MRNLISYDIWINEQFHIGQKVVVDGKPGTILSKNNESGKWMIRIGNSINSVELKNIKDDESDFEGPFDSVAFQRPVATISTYE